MTKEIIQVGSSILRKTSRVLMSEEVTSAKIKRLIAGMHKILSRCSDGIALAAPQVGENVRLFVISPKAFGEEPSPDESLVYINPIIRKFSAKKIDFEEGCLSVKNIYGKVRRREKIIVEALNERGRKFRRGASGLLAELIQHEIDHLDGILFLDSAKDLHEIKQEAKQNDNNP